MENSVPFAKPWFGGGLLLLAGARSTNEACIPKGVPDSAPPSTRRRNSGVKWGGCCSLDPRPQGGGAGDSACGTVEGRYLPDLPPGLESGGERMVQDVSCQLLLNCVLCVFTSISCIASEVATLLKIVVVLRSGAISL